MANEQNLIPQAHKLTVEEASMGGIASGKVRKQRKMLKELLEEVADKQVKSEKIKATLAEMGFEDNEQTNQLAIAVRVILGAVQGDHKSIAEFMDGTGQKITRNINENHNVEYKPLVDLTKRKKNGDSNEETQ